MCHLVVVLALALLALPSIARGEFVFALDSVGSGSAYMLTGFDGTTLTGANKQGSLAATFDQDTIFRTAKLDRYAPTDPCRTYAASYNFAGVTGDEGGLLAAIAQLAANGCGARVNVVHSQAPVDPCRSFRPIPLSATLP